jgi:hypothetical protein
VCVWGGGGDEEEGFSIWWRSKLATVTKNDGE